MYDTNVTRTPTVDKIADHTALEIFGVEFEGSRSV